MEPAVQIRLLRENLALAIALSGAARRGVITAGFVPNRNEFLTADGSVVKVSAPLEIHDTQELVRCVNNQVRGAFAFSALQTNRVLESLFGNAPIQTEESDLQAARCVFYLLNRSVSQSLMTPVWSCPPDYQRQFDVEFASFSLDASTLDGSNVSWEDFGGLERYLDLLEFCSVEVAGCDTQPQYLAQTAAEEPEPLPAQHYDEAVPEKGSTDGVTEFIEARCTSGSEDMIVAKDLYDAYVDWCQKQNEEPLGQRSFGMQLTAMGFQRRRRGRGRHWWLGIGTRETVNT